MEVACRKGKMWSSTADFTALLILPHSIYAASPQIFFEFPPSGNTSSPFDTIYHSNCTAPICFINDTRDNATLNETIIGLNPTEPLADVILMSALSVVLGLMILVTVIGNVFVIAAILMERNLQNVANYLIVSLAVADLMVACLVMPLGAVYVIQVARKIYKSFTGNLETDILTYPEFPGKEKNYLRAQISRISAGTQIAPLGYYTFGGEEAGEGDEEDEVGEEEAETGGKTEYKTNPKYDPPSLKDLTDRSMTFWVHSAPYILPQGRLTWWNPTPAADVEDEELGEELGEEEEEDDKEKGSKAEPETGPPLLTPLSEDASLETVSPWSVRSSSNVLDTYALAVVRSNLWPGAYTFSTQGKIFHNIYFGFGLKYMQHNFSPMPLPPVQQEYAVGPEIMEVLDPTGAEEEKWRIDHLPKPKPKEDEEKGETDEGEGEEEEEEEEEDD